MPTRAETAARSPTGTRRRGRYGCGFQGWTGVQKLGGGVKRQRADPRRAARRQAGLPKLHGSVGNPLPQRGFAAEGALPLAENLRPRQPPPDPVRGIGGRRGLRLDHGADEFDVLRLHQPGLADGVIPDSTIRLAMQRAGVALSPHGFRSTFRTWAQERGENWEAAEISLSRRVGGSVVASYARSDMFEM